MALAVLAAWISATAAEGAFFQVSETCPLGLGAAYSGVGAIGDSACAVWLNPAALVRLEGEEVVFGLHSIAPSVRFENGASRIFTAARLEGGPGGDAGETALVPNAYYGRRVGPRLAIGLGVNSPFGLATEYEPGWVGRYHALRSELRTINFQTGLGYRLTDKVSVGLSAGFVSVDAELSQALDLGSACLVLELSEVRAAGSCGATGILPQRSDGVATVEADGDGIGFSAGLLWEPARFFRVGLGYRSAISLSLEGGSSVATPGAAAATIASTIGATDSRVRAELELPDSASFHLAWRFAKRWEFSGDWTRTDWSGIRELRIVDQSGARDSSITLELRDSVRKSIGITWTPVTRWTLSVGVASDETASRSARLQTVRLPDADRVWATAGATYSGFGSLEPYLAFARIRSDGAPIEKLAFPNTEDFLRGSLRGTYALDADIVSLGLRWRLRATTN
ncbi:MAG: OmpP1/FadL family transporter [Thermoanaerobaculia bacterium]